ncbi:hypothetical protein DPMN_117579 [Dreissena polymorpha]|uniref:Uncharacterized protein n=1 Tax=Dreissena polymorpha TaxID=45954 RepID=A0A9D4GIH0_DREPO|nr:hypothetical protein DPMN_117579 [Dreissena polymorpha]
MYRLLNEVSVSISGHITCSFQLLQTAISQCKRCRASLCACTSKRKKVEPGESLQSPGRAPVYRHYAGTHRGYTGIRPRQSCGNAPV